MNNEFKCLSSNMRDTTANARTPRPVYLLTVRLSCKTCTNQRFQTPFKRKIDESEKKSHGMSRVGNWWKRASQLTIQCATDNLLLFCVIRYAGIWCDIYWIWITDDDIAPDGFRRWFSTLLLCNTELWLNVLRKPLPSLDDTLLTYSWLVKGNSGRAGYATFYNIW